MRGATRRWRNSTRRCWPRSKRPRARFEAGTIDFLALLDAERELLLARDRLAQGQTAAATSLVAVYRSLAGGWR